MSGEILPQGIALGEPCLVRGKGGRYGVFVPVRHTETGDTVEGMWAATDSQDRILKRKLEGVQQKFPLTSKLNYLNEKEYDLAKAVFREAVRKDFEKEIEAENHEDDSRNTRTEERNHMKPAGRKVAELFSSSEEGAEDGEDEDEVEDVSSSEGQLENEEEDEEDEDISGSSSNVGSIVSESDSMDGAQGDVSEKVIKEYLLDKAALGQYYTHKYAEPILEMIRENGGNKSLLQDWQIRIRIRTNADGTTNTDISYLDGQGHVSKSRPEIVRSLGLISKVEAKQEAFSAIAKLIVNSEEIRELEKNEAKEDDKLMSEDEEISEEESETSSPSPGSLYECEHDCGFTHKRRRTVENHEDFCSRNPQNADNLTKAQIEQNRYEPILKTPLIQGSSNDLIIERIGIVLPEKDFCCCDKGIDVIYPCGFRSKRKLLNQAAKPETYINEIQPGPKFLIRNSGNEVIALDNSPLSAWRTVIGDLIDHFLHISVGMEASIVMSEMNAKARRGQTFKNKKSMTIGEEETETLHIKFEKASSEKWAGIILNSESQKTLYPIVTGFDGCIGKPPARIGDKIISIKIDGRKTIRKFNSDQFPSVLERCRKDLVLTVKRTKLKPNSDQVSLSILKRIRADLWEKSEEHAFQFACCLFGLIEGSNRVRLLCEAMRPSVEMPRYKHYFRYSRSERTAFSRKISAFDAIINACIKTIPKGLRNLERRCGVANRIHMRAEDVLSGKLRIQLRKSDQMEHWMRAMKMLMPKLLQMDVETLNKDQYRQRNAIICMFQLPCSILHKQLTKRDGFSLQPLYDWDLDSDNPNLELRKDNILDIQQGVKQVLDMVIARIEISSWKVSHQGALRRGIEKYGNRLQDLLSSETDDGATLHEYGYIPYSLLARCISHEIKAAGLSWKKSKKRIGSENKTSVIKRIKGQSGILSKRAARIVRGVLNRLVNNVVKDYRRWKVQQRRLRMAAARRSKKQTQYQESADYTAHEYATLCAAVENYGKDWREIMKDPVFSKCFRPHHQSARSLARAWSDMRSVISVHGRHDRLYPVMGYYIRFTEKASKRRGEDDKDFLAAHTKDGKDPQADHMYLFIGKGCNELLSSKLALEVCLRRSVINPSDWIIGPANSGETSWLYSKDGMIFSFYAPSEEWRRDNKTKFFVMKNPDEEEEDEEDTEILTDEQVVERIKHIIHKRMLLARRQIRLEKRLESLELLRDCDQNYLLSLPSGQANGEVNGLLQKRRREGDTLTPPNRKHLKTEMP